MYVAQSFSLHFPLMLLKYFFNMKHKHVVYVTKMLQSCMNNIDQSSIQVFIFVKK